VILFRRAFAAGSDSARRGGVPAAKAVAPALCGLGVAAVLGATLCSPIAPAGADSITTLQQQAAALSQEMLREQLQINAFQQQRAADMAGLAADEAQLKQMGAQLGVLHHRIGSDLSQLRIDAVKVYVAGGTQADGTNSLFAASPSNGATSVYSQVMTGNLTTAVAKLKSDRQALRTAETAQQQVASAAQRQLQGADVALVAAQSTEQALARQRSNVTGALAAAISQQQAQEAAAARAAAAAAAAASQPSGGGVSPPAAAPSPVPGGMPQLPPFLRCVIQAESGGNYQAISPTGQYMGAFQFAQPTWNEAARLAGIPSLIGVPPYKASPRDQDLLAIALYNADGEQPWYDPCRN
jgi:hypothetical protein